MKIFRQVEMHIAPRGLWGSVLVLQFQWLALPGGSLFLGLRADLPALAVDDDGSKARHVTGLTIGAFLCSARIEFRGEVFKPIK